MPNEPKFQYIDRPEISETFCDGIRSLVFDGQTFRIELKVTRMSEATPGQQQPSGAQYTACRLALPPSAAIELAAKLSGVLKVMKERGVLKEIPPKPTGGSK
ncbi:MAG: hypothetical protein A3G81_08045 [Betaproteobacteria bacterium RIFCSPLOWO2_12_FULL_65_14]|nr:MAG: hypothetical protein A3G81_08045 [Betaproteobacteria bacterium RIFCSPLOWO2_12_FULL_65_14]